MMPSISALLLPRVGRLISDEIRTSINAVVTAMPDAESRVRELEGSIRRKLTPTSAVSRTDHGRVKGGGDFAEKAMLEQG